MSREEFFEKELDQIKIEKNRELAQHIINNILPDRFFTIQPSSSGKYHPACTHRTGGLVIHTKRLIYLALLLADSHKLSPEEKDLLIIAGIAHDMAKKNKYDDTIDKYTFAQHHLEAMEILKENEKDLIKFATKSDLNKIYDMIMYHMGPFSAKGYEKDLEEYTMLELIIYHADYLASRKFIVTPVDDANAEFEIGDMHTGS